MGRILNIIKALAAPPSRREAFKRHAPSADAIADPEVLRLFQRREELKRLDYEFDIHGSRRGHRYNYYRMSNADLVRLEAELGFELPDQCRRWLASVGIGSGPGYGLTCEPIRRNPNIPAPVFQGPLPPFAVHDVSELTPELLLKLDAARKTPEGAWDHLYLFGLRSGLGSMHLCEHGCCWDSYLIVAGPMKGHVIDDTAGSGDYLPGVLSTFAAGYGATPPAVLPTFFEWLDYWTERSIGEVEQARLIRQKWHGNK